ncbi:helix-turn-helix domain-containing protein [Clostridium sp. MCC353]|uniref:AraC family transcriptional regulator n=1 Tax=Clostridium sp. MCC353 TaxID=2592646 RepID=UPI001C01603A|nr:helix-turn-helix domain-containing protein [Clostridium sp. MCC353]MBT9776228.1 helix-turn-helix domain-containing protein [Clostridium sp. MCC353]
MKLIRSIKLNSGSKEELLPNIAPDFPYIASRVELDQYMGKFVPWHWHNAVEVFYIESGALEYYTPKGRTLFPAGTGGMVNSNVLHMTKKGMEHTVSFLHIFEPSLIAGGLSSRIWQKYVVPLITNTQAEIIALSPDVAEQREVLDRICGAFELSENDFGYEMDLRNALSDIWVRMFELSGPFLEENGLYDRVNNKIKLMMTYVHENYDKKITIGDLAASAFTSERECFRMFHDYLRTTPAKYIKSCRLQMACNMLARGQEPVTSIGHLCGLGSSSYFGKTFRESMGCTPLEYRRKWQDNDR